MSAAALLESSARALPRRAVSLHVAAALALLATTASALDDEGTAVLVLRGVALLLAAALALAVDEPSAVLLDATPTSLARRLAARLGVLGLLLLAVWGLALALATARGSEVPMAALTLELGGLATLGLATAAVLRRWWQVFEPAVVIGPVLFAVLVVVYHLPRRFGLIEGQLWGPPWEAAHLRWTAVLVASLSLLILGLADPATARATRPLRRRQA